MPLVVQVTLAKAIWQNKADKYAVLHIWGVVGIFSPKTFSPLKNQEKNLYLHTYKPERKVGREPPSIKILSAGKMLSKQTNNNISPGRWHNKGQQPKVAAWKAEIRQKLKLFYHESCKYWNRMS